MRRGLKSFALVVAAGSAAAMMISAPAASAGQDVQHVHARVSRSAVKHVRLDWAPPRTAAQTAALTAQRAARTPIQDFTHTVTDGTSQFTYSMIGKNPYLAQTNPATTIRVFLQPVVFHFTDGNKWDPTVGDSCDGTSALTRTQNSPIFKNQTISFGGTSVGSAQYVDAFQRAQFYEQTKPTGINPGYHVKLKLVTLPKITVNVPAASSAEEDILFCGNYALGGVEINYWDHLVQTTLLPNMAAQGLTLKDFPFFLFGNVVMYDTNPGNCCILGYHGSKGSGATFQSYGNGMYDNSGDFSGSSDISAISHEVAEWMDDPNGVNPTKPWGHIGQVSGCQNNLEVGDPLSGTTFSDHLNGKTYHPQELAFAAWFYHQSPSQGINGWYSDGGTFTTTAAACS